MRLLIDRFNKACSNIASIYLKARDEYMSAIRFHTPSKGNLSQLPYIFRKPKPFGKDIKMVACSVTGDLIFLENHWDKEGINSSRYHLELDATADCTKIFMEEMKGLGQRSLKGSTRDCFLLNSWFLLKKEEESAASIGVDLIGAVKTNTKVFFKATIEGLTKDRPAGSYIVLRSKPMVIGEMPLLSIGYK